MRRMVRLLCLTLFFVSGAILSAQQGRQITTFTSVTTSPAVHTAGSGIVYHQLSWTKSGTVTTCTVRADSSTDGISWNTGDVVAAQDCTGAGPSSVANTAAFNYIRVNMTVLTGAGATVRAIWSGWVTNPAGGSGVSITGTSPIVLTPSPTTGTGVASCPTCAVGPGTSVANHVAKFSNTDGLTLADGGAIPTGGLSSVGLALPTEFTVTGSPLTSNGTLSAAWHTQTAGNILRTPIGGAGATLVQKCFNNSTTGVTSLVVTCGSTFTAGTRLIVETIVGTFSTSITPVHSPDTFTTDRSGNINFAPGYKISSTQTAGGGTTVTVNLGASDSVSVQVLEYSGALTLDTSNSCVGFGSTGSCSVTTTAANDLVIGMFETFNANGPTYTATGFTQQYAIGGAPLAARQYHAVYDRTAVATGAYPVSDSDSAGGAATNWVGVVAYTTATSSVPGMGGIDFTYINGTIPDSGLPATGTAGTCGDATHSCATTTDAKGRVTAQVSNAIAAGYPAAVVVSVTNAAELDVPNCITSSNRDYQARVSLLTMTAGASVNLFVQFSSDNGATYDTATHYFYGRNLVQLNGATTAQQGNGSGAGFQPSGLSADVYASGEVYSFGIDMYFPRNTTAQKLFNYQSAIYKPAGAYSANGSLLYTGTGAVNAFRILASGAGTFTATVTCQPLP